MAHRKLPEPTTEELEAGKTHWIGLNPFWWSIMQGWIATLRNPIHWLQYTQEIDQGIIDIMTDDLPPLIGAKVYRSASQTISNNVETDITFNAEDFDTHDFFTPSSTDIVIPIAGYYAITPTIAWDGNATGYRQINIKRNGATEQLIRLPASPTASTSFPTHHEGYFDAGDVVRIAVRQTSGGNLNVLSGLPNCNCAIVFIGS